MNIILSESYLLPYTPNVSHNLTLTVHILDIALYDTTRIQHCVRSNYSCNHKIKDLKRALEVMKLNYIDLLLLCVEAYPSLPWKCRSNKDSHSQTRQQ